MTAPSHVSPGTEPALEPCPLCRSKAIFLEQDFPPIGKRYGVACRECDCRCDYRKVTKEEAAAQWNWRAGGVAQEAANCDEIAQTLCGSDGNGFLEDCAATRLEAYRIRARDLLEAYHISHRTPAIPSTDGGTP